MSEVLHDKYRPSKLSEIVGQDAIKRSFAEVIKKRSSHAFLLNGPSGTGKTTLSRIGAKMLGANGTDLVEIDAATFTGVDDMRTVRSGLQYRPFGDGVKVFIVDECHMLSKAAFNSLLKSIEEPPEWVYWFFCTTELNKVPETIKTRCTRYELESVPTAELIELLDGIAKREKLAASPGVIELCAKRAQGSPRQALVFLGAVANVDKVEDARSLLKAAEGSSTVIDLCRALHKGDDFMLVLPILADLKDANAESVRQVIRDYMTKVILGAKSPKAAGKALEVLDAFSTPFPSGDGISPVALAVGRLLLS